VKVFDLNINNSDQLSHNDILILLNTGRRPLWLHSANLKGAILTKADLIGAIMCRANLCEADLFQADLSGADLSDADLSNANLSEAKLSGANLLNCDMSNVKLLNAKYTVDTQWPKEFEPDTYGAIMRDTHPH